MESNSLIASAIEIIDKRGQSALKEASEHILKNQYGTGVISEALNYYATAIFPRVLPIFPALIHLSCEAVGGNPKETEPLAAAMLLITASGDIHDDIIDRSTHKFRKQTLFGKYGKDITLLAGDALLMHGMNLLQENLKQFSPTQKTAIFDLMTRSMYELAEAEATETFLWKKETVTPQESYAVIARKATVAELHCRIGAVIGVGNKNDLESISSYGRAIGILSVMKDEFMDLNNHLELKDRLLNEMPPYPMICAMQNQEFRNQFSAILAKRRLLKKELTIITKAVESSVEVKQIKQDIRKISETELLKNPILKNIKRGKEATIILKALANEL
jgi:geranylgeranyl pyrophosphate synthase